MEPLNMAAVSLAFNVAIGALMQSSGEAPGTLQFLALLVGGSIPPIMGLKTSLERNSRVLLAFGMILKLEWMTTSLAWNRPSGTVRREGGGELSSESKSKASA